MAERSCSQQIKDGAADAAAADALAVRLKQLIGDSSVVYLGNGVFAIFLTHHKRHLR